MELKKKVSPFLQLFTVLRSKSNKLKKIHNHSCAFLGMRFIHWERASQEDGNLS